MLFTVIFGFLIRYCQAEYITQPVSVNTSLNSTVTFTCEATGVSLLFFYVGETPASETVNVKRGFIEFNQDTINGTIRRRQLSVHAREINNNTYVYCFGAPSNIRSNNATLTIQGIVSALCKGEYPNSIPVNILNATNAVINNTSIATQVNDQLMIVSGSTSISNLNTFTVNVSLSNNGGTFNNVSSFGFSFLGPVTNIDSSIDNCSTIDITWTAPTVDDRVPILYYILRIYDAITGSLVSNVSVYDTSYQFVDNNLFIHCYTYVITGANELGEGISNNDTFSYQRGTYTFFMLICLLIFHST
ncbi:PREDICTED: uncharacterized protein LOC109587276 [Amphimedon queenslandica]|uniref:Fibronectin type-III domain-containing protein n=1 Tax=Amphimedon queenslandica TaxID=400682 RepID=A0AAN0JQI3_AMPQE|nr:PREDICTED: uncharacterized protein LOC109587276 [Amphimedon queenslandica]|eukprot:XP_019859078.1 PREDICTED: uncharacterized protein LOC109587276 [Amphimedon queenslandica]